MYQVWSKSLTDVDSRVFTRMLQKDGRTEGSVTISLRNFVGEGIIMLRTQYIPTTIQLLAGLESKKKISFTVYSLPQKLLMKLTSFTFLH